MPDALGRIQPGERISPETEFKSGLTPWNKGRKGSCSEYNKQRLREANSGHPSWNAGRRDGIYKNCEKCGKEFYTFKSYAHKRFCSIGCRPSALKGRTLSEEHKRKIAEKHIGKGGPTHWNWKHGLKRHRQRNYDGRKYRDWRKTILLRDEFTCQECGEKNVRIEVHHIKPYEKFPELRFNIDNGITLCVYCHRDQHSCRR